MQEKWIRALCGLKQRKTQICSFNDLVSREIDVKIICVENLSGCKTKDIINILNVLAKINTKCVVFLGNIQPHSNCCFDPTVPIYICMTFTCTVSIAECLLRFCTESFP